MSTTAPELQVLLLPCPCCGQRQAGINVRLYDLDETSGGAFHCAECDEVFSMADVRGFIEQWSRVLDWVMMAPKPL